MINTLQELLEDYARYSCMEDIIDPETSKELQKGVEDYIKQLNDSNLLTLTNVSCDCDKKIKDLVNWVKSDLAEESSEKVGKWSTPYREEKIRFLNKLLEIGKL